MTAEPYMSKYLNQLAIKNGVPISGHFELTPNCNFLCPMCYVHEGMHKNELGTDTWLRFAEEAKKTGTLFLLLTGGEPFLRSDFEELYTSLSQMGFVISINTNGSLLSDYIDLLKKYPPFRINISLYAGSNEAYKNFCGVDAFDTVTKNIGLLKSAGIGIRLNSVFTEKNSEQAADIIRFAKENELIIKHTSYAYPQIRLGFDSGTNNARLSADRAAETEVKADLLRLGEAQFANKAKTVLKIEDNITSPDGYLSVRCRAGRSAYWITWDGKMRACTMLPTPETEPLNVGFKKAWEDLRHAVGEIKMPSECAMCEKRSVCPVCAAMCYTETGSFDKKPQYLCDYFNGMRRLYSEYSKNMNTADMTGDYIEEENDDC